MQKWYTEKSSTGDYNASTQYVVKILAMNGKFLIICLLYILLIFLQLQMIRNFADVQSRIVDFTF